MPGLENLNRPFTKAGLLSFSGTIREKLNRLGGERNLLRFAGHLPAAVQSRSSMRSTGSARCASGSSPVIRSR